MANPLVVKGLIKQYRLLCVILASSLQKTCKMQHLHDDYFLKAQKEPERSLFAVRICHYIGVKVPVVQWVESTTH